MFNTLPIHVGNEHYVRGDWVRVLERLASNSSKNIESPYVTGNPDTFSFAYQVCAGVLESGMQNKKMASVWRFGYQLIIFRKWHIDDFIDWRTVLDCWSLFSYFCLVLLLRMSEYQRFCTNKKLVSHLLNNTPHNKTYVVDKSQNAQNFSLQYNYLCRVSNN